MEKGKEGEGEPVRKSRKSALHAGNGTHTCRPPAARPSLSRVRTCERNTQRLFTQRERRGRQAGLLNALFGFSPSLLPSFLPSRHDSHLALPPCFPCRYPLSYASSTAMASTLDAQLRERSAPSHETANTNHESRPMYSAGNNRRVAERAGAGVVACGLKVAAFIRWAFSEGTNDRGGRNGRRGEGEGQAALRPSREPHLSGRRKRGRTGGHFA